VRWAVAAGRVGAVTRCDAMQSAAAPELQGLGLAAWRFLPLLRFVRMK